MAVTHLVDGGITIAFILTLTITMEVTIMMALFHSINLHGLPHHSLKLKSAQLTASDIS